VQQSGGPRPFDVATRRLIETDPVGWLTWVGLPVDGPVDGPVRPIDSEVSTVLAEVDKVLRVDTPSPWLAHLEHQSSRDPGLPFRLLQYHALLLHEHRLPVATIVVLLRSEASGRELSGRFEQRGPTGDVTISLNYTVVHLWERPVDELLAAGLGVLPLAPLAAYGPARLPEIIDVLDDRFEQESPSPSVTGELWAATLLLMGIRYDAAEATQLLRGVTRLRESTTYQMILEEGIEKGREEGREKGRAEGEIAGMRRAVLHLGTRRFGAPPPATAARLESLTDPATVQRLIDGVLTADSWDELLTDTGA
jgi:predicted transposase YdaD